MDVFFDQIVELCKRERTAPKWVIVRSPRTAYTLAERVVRGGTDWVNLRCISLFHVALEMAAPYLLEHGIDPTPEGLGPALLVKLLEDLPAENDVPRYFRPLLNQPRIGETLWKTLHEFRMAGLHGRDLQARSPLEGGQPDSPKLLEFRALVLSFEDYLAENGVADRAAVLQKAFEHLEVAPIGHGDFVLAAPDCAWSALERRLIEALPGQHLRASALDLPGLEKPRRLPPWIEWVRPKGRTNAERLAWCAAPHQSPATLADRSLELFVAGGREAEVEEVLRRILSAERGLDQVELSVTRPDLLALIWEKLERHELPGTFESGVPVRLTRPGRALCGFLNWVEGGFVAYELRQWLQSGVVLGPPNAARLLERVAPTWGRHTYGNVLTQASRRLQLLGIEEISDQIQELDVLAAWIARLLELVPESPRFALKDWLAACRFVTAELSVADARLDRAARNQILVALRELEHLNDFQRSLPEAARLVRERLDELSVGASRSAPGTLHVTQLSEAGQSGRKWLYCLGLEEGHFRSGSEDPVLLDEERPEVMASSEDRVTEGVWACLSRLASGAEHVCLSYSCRDLRDGRTTPPSWPFFHAGRLMWPEIDSHSRLAERLGNPKSVVPADPGDAVGAADWWLSCLNGKGPATLNRVVHSFPGLWRGLTAESKRDSKELSEWSGKVPSAAHLYDPRQNGKPVSASRLETLGTCPFKFFLRYVLKLKPLEIQPPEPNQWLDELTRGSLLHEIFAEYHRGLRGRSAHPQPEDESELVARAAGRLEAQRKLRPPASDQQFEHEQQAIFRDLRRFLELELREYPGRVPVAVEVSFAMPQSEGEPLDRADPVTIMRSIRLLGRIDRIDRITSGDPGARTVFEVVDYKTGSDWGQDKPYRGGRKLQFALYALAADELLKPLDPDPKVTGTSYYFPTDRARQAWHFRASPNREQLGELLDELLFPTLSGAFLQTDTEDDCRICDFKGVCGPKPHLRANRKTGQAHDHLRKLRLHE